MLYRAQNVNSVHGRINQDTKQSTPPKYNDKIIDTKEKREEKEVVLVFCSRFLL